MDIGYAMNTIKIRAMSIEKAKIFTYKHLEEFAAVAAVNVGKLTVQLSELLLEIIATILVSVIAALVAHFAKLYFAQYSLPKWLKKKK